MNSRILILTAMDEEYSSALDGVKRSFTQKSQNENSTLFTKGNQEVLVAKVGIGPILSSIHSFKLFSEFKPDVFLNIGLAGSIDQSCNIGDIILVDQIIHYDYCWIASGELKLMNSFDPFMKYVKPDFPKQEADQKIRNKISNLMSSQFDFRVKPILSGASFWGDYEAKTSIKERGLGSDLVDMESIGIHMASKVAQIPGGYIKIISDGYAESNEKSFDELLSTFKHCGKILSKILDLLVQKI